MPAGTTPRVASVEKAMRVLHAFGPHVAELSIRQIGERVGVPRSTVHAICATLCDAGMLELVPGGRYRLGTALMELGGQVIARTGLVAAAERVLPSLALATAGETHLGQLVGGWVVYVSRVPIGRGISMRNSVGLRAPAHLGGCGKAALAHLDSDQVRTLVGAVCAVERRPIPDLDELAVELASCRRFGYLRSASFQAGRASVASPVFDGTGCVVGGVSVAGLASTFVPSVVTRIGEQVMAAADQVSRRLASPHRPVGTPRTRRNERR